MNKTLPYEVEQRLLNTPSELECFEGLARLGLLTEEGNKKLQELRKVTE